MKWHDIVIAVLITVFAWLCFTLAFTLPDQRAIIETQQPTEQVEEI